MKNSYTPVLAVALYNRPLATLRCLESLSAAVYPDENVRLVISIDNDENKNKNIVEIADAFHWEHGEKEVIYHPEKLGVRNHFNFCGDLSQKYGSVIFIEDDLFVSRYYYDYTIQALEYYQNDGHVAGISLFNKTRIEGWRKMYPFIPLDDGADNYFLQQASSGQIWTDGMWSEFKKWNAVNGNAEFVNSLPQVPTTVKRWPANTWKKYYNTYMILNDKYYVFPRISLVTNFDDVGTHSKSNSVYHQSPLLVSNKRFNFSSFNDSLSVYDSFFEILPGIIKKLNPSLSEYDFEVNLYGDKDPRDISKELVLSKRAGKKNIKQFNLAMKPHELNVIFDREGDKIFLCHKDSLEDKNGADEFVEDLIYFYRRNFTLNEIMKIMIYKIRNNI
jgi:hypothetical protein